MDFLNRLKINGKLALLTGVSSFFLLVIVIYSLAAFSVQNRQFQTIINERLKNRDAAQVMMENVLSIHNKLFEMITWKTASYDTNLLVKLLDDIRLDISNNTAFIDQVLSNKMKTEERDKFKQIKKQFNDYSGWGYSTIDILMYDINVATFYMGTANDKFEELKKNLSELKNSENTLIMKSYRDNQANFTISFILFVVITVLSSILLAFLLYRIRSMITSPLNALVTAVKRISEGDFTEKIGIKSNDEIGEVVDGVNGLIGKLNADLGEVEKVAGKVKSASESSDSAVQSGLRNMKTIREQLKLLEDRTEKSITDMESLTSTVEEMVRNVDGIMGSIETQTAAVEEGASSIEEMARNIESTFKTSNRSQEISGNLNRVSEEGNEAVQKTLEAINEVGTNTQKINEMLKFITDITAQTNMLSLNASIEASHAGDSGKGFSIVASQIRVLSENSSKNAKNIETMVKTILTNIGETLDLSGKAQQGLRMISQYSEQNDEVVKNLNTAMNEQKNVAQSILQSTQTLVKISEEVKTSMIEQKRATESFSKSVMEYRDMSMENRNFTKNHIQYLNDLLAAQEKVSEMIRENKNQSEILEKLVSHFKVTK